MRNIILYGGAFDPVHYGHLQTAFYIQSQFKFDTFSFIPCKDPVHKNICGATSHHRLEMLELALSDKIFNGQSLQEIGVSIDTIEIKSNELSFTYNTLKSYLNKYAAHKNTRIWLLIGYDNLLNFTTWYRWQDILKQTTILVMKRSCDDNTKSIPSILTQNVQLQTLNHNNFPGNKNTNGNVTTHPLPTSRGLSVGSNDLSILSEPRGQAAGRRGEQLHGNIYFVNAGEYAISSQAIRKSIKLGEDVSKWLPGVVLQYITKNKLYQD